MYCAAKKCKINCTNIYLYNRSGSVKDKIEYWNYDILYLFLFMYNLKYFNNLKICYIWYRLFKVGNHQRKYLCLAFKAPKYEGWNWWFFWFQCWLSSWHSLRKYFFSSLGKSNKLTRIINLLFLALLISKTLKKNPNLSSFCIPNCSFTWDFKTIFYILL